MFGNILIDKLRFSVKRDEINPYEAQYKLNAIMSEHFRKDNYTANFDKRYFRLTFTPTLYLDSVEAMEGLPILNLEMISEQKLLQLLKISRMRPRFCRLMLLLRRQEPVRQEEASLL